MAGMALAAEGEETGPAIFKASLAGVRFGMGGVAFDAVVILRDGEETLKVSGFSYPR